MRWLFDILSTSIGKKVLMAITGLFLFTFLAQHLYSNAFLFVSEEAFNEHAEAIASNVFVRTVEVVLFLAIVAHAANGIHLAAENRKARGTGYRMKRGAGFGTLASRSMIVTGSVVFIFIVIHLRNFFWEARFGTVHAGASLYQVVTEAFTIPGYVALYAGAMVLLGVHLFHGFQSAFRTLGIEHARYTPLIRALGAMLSVAIPAGFASMPLYFFVQSLS